VIGFVEYKYVSIGLAERFGGSNPGKSAANDNDPRFCLCHGAPLCA
jgi:hypothetical protein